MAELFKLFGTLALVALLLAAAWLILSKIGLLKPKAGKESSESPYLSRDRFLSQAEAGFYRDLLAALPILTASMGEGAPPLLFAKPRLADVLRTDSDALRRDDGQGRSARSKQTSAQNTINAKHVDFLLCDPATTRPLIVIELDDASHQRQDRVDRDDFVNSACAAAKLPVLHIPCRPNGARYDPRQLAAQIEVKLNG